MQQIRPHQPGIRCATVPVTPFVALALLIAACGGGGGGDKRPAVVTISGRISYEAPPPTRAPVCDGLDFAALQTRPARGVTVQLIASPGGTVLGTTRTSATGEYALTVPEKTGMSLHVRAELKQSGAPSWDVEVRDNTQSTGVPLTQRPLYTLDGSVFNSGSAHSTRNFTATTGWGGVSYTGVRAAAPFAILDTLYQVMTAVAAQDPAIVYPPLDVYWSINNNSSPGSGDFAADIDSGEIGTSFYAGGAFSGLFLLGMDGDDTEEFDNHVIAHEWGHYFEDKFSRSDSIGGEHGANDRLDARVAWSEGWATALSGITLADPDYCDSLWFQGNLRGFHIDIENWDTGAAAGWYNEFSVLKFIYDMWDTEVDGTDIASLGFGPIYEVMSGPEAATPAFTSLFSFASALKAVAPTETAFIDSQLARENVTAIGIEPFGSTEVNDAGGAPDVLPVYSTVVPDGSVLDICSNSQFDRPGGGLGANGNRLSEHRFLRMAIANPGPYTFVIQTDAATIAQLPPNESSDPDIYLYRDGQPVDEGISGDANQEIFTTAALAAGDYIMDVHEWRYEDGTTPNSFPARSCFTIQVTAAP